MLLSSSQEASYVIYEWCVHFFVTIYIFLVELLPVLSIFSKIL